MSTSRGNILLGVSGSIAVYKSLLLTRLLIKKGYEVKVVMTSAAKDFVTPLSFATLSKNQVFSDISSDQEWNNHVDLGLWADVLLIVPATANTIAKMAHGIVDNMLLACYTSAKCPVLFAPAMDRDMWLHPSNQANIKTLKSYGNHMIAPTNGELASGLEGVGRVAEPEDCLLFIEDFLCKKQDLLHKTVVITAGPTFEAIDPVRFIGNKSTGKMGIAIAEECISRGATVHLVLGPSHVPISDDRIQVLRVTSAQEMYDRVHTYTSADIFIMAAAVADYKPKHYSEEKIKKGQGKMSEIELERTLDIAKSIGDTKSDQQILVGFALETKNELANAKSKLERKNFDLIVLNSLNDKGAGFKHDTNKVTIIRKDNKSTAYELKSKSDVAKDIIQEIIDYQEQL